MSKAITIENIIIFDIKDVNQTTSRYNMAHKMKHIQNIQVYEEFLQKISI